MKHEKRNAEPRLSCSRSAAGSRPLPGLGRPQISSNTLYGRSAEGDSPLPGFGVSPNIFFLCSRAGRKKAWLLTTKIITRFSE